MSRNITLSLTLLTSVFATSVFAADADIDATDLGGFPAVSGFNAKIETGYVAYDFDNGAIFDSADGYLVQGAVSVPLGERFGFQLDAGFQKTSADLIGGGNTSIDSRGIGGHLFWRRPDTGLIGAYAHYTRHEVEGVAGDIRTFRYGVEGEWYAGDWTVQAFAGVDRLEVFALGSDTFFSGKADVSYYFTDNFLVKAGVTHSFEQTAGVVGLEALWDTGNISPTFFADATFSEDSQSIMAGLKIYFGPTAKSLKARHREDDPTIGLFNNFGDLGHCVNASVSANARRAVSRSRSIVGPPPPTTTGPGVTCGAGGIVVDD